MLLSSQGVPDDVFIRLQSKMLEKLAGKLLPKTKMKNYITLRMKKNLVLLRDGIKQ